MSFRALIFAIMLPLAAIAVLSHRPATMQQAVDMLPQAPALRQR
jgi:hypothetical protein